MRLLDLIAHTNDPVLVTCDAHGRTPFELSGAKDFANKVPLCPLRFVIADELTRASASLAFSDGTRLADCLDLVRIPASAMWVEWSDSVHQQVVCASGAVGRQEADVSQRQVGVLLEASSSGRSAVVHTFWTARDASGAEIAEMAPIETHINLDERFLPTADGGDLLRGEFVSLPSYLPHIADLLERVRFRLEASWVHYYRKVASEPRWREDVVRKSLGAVAYDIPLLLAFFLLLNAKGATRPVEIRRERLNQKRLARDRRPLLDHIEVHATLPGSAAGDAEDHEASPSRQSPRLHHVRGHLVRREDRIFWRVPHLRGKALRGVIRSRTVCLSFASP
jgi:hypothetical protein